MSRYAITAKTRFVKQRVVFVQIKCLNHGLKRFVTFLRELVLKKNNNKILEPCMGRVKIQPKLSHSTGKMNQPFKTNFQGLAG